MTDMSANIDQEEFDNIISSFSDIIQLDPNRIEHRQLKIALTYALSRRENLTAFLESDTISFIVDALAAIGVYAQYGADTAWGEGNLETARLDSSIRAIIRTLGVRQARKRPARIEVSLARSGEGNLVIPPYTVFTSGAENFFNREEIVFGEDESTLEGIFLYEGRLVTETYRNQNSGNQSDEYAVVSFGESDFSVSNDDVRILLNENLSGDVQVTQLPVWYFRNNPEAPGVNRFVSDFTTSDGRCEIKFGSRLFGFLPSPRDRVRIQYAVTKGREGNSVIGTGVSLSIDSRFSEQDITTTSTSVAANGADEVPASTYRSIGPQAFSSGNRAVDQASYNATILAYPGVVDGIAIPQSSFAPDRVEFANLIRLCAITNQVDGSGDLSSGDNQPNTWDGEEWGSFIDYMNTRGLVTARYVRHDPVAIPVDVDAVIFVSQASNVNIIRMAAEQAVRNLFRSKFRTLQLPVYRSDIIETITNSITGINFVELRQPVNDITEFNDIFPEIAFPTPVVSVETGSLSSNSIFVSSSNPSLPNFDNIESVEYFFEIASDAANMETSRSRAIQILNENGGTEFSIGNNSTTDNRINTFVFNNLNFGERLLIYRRINSDGNFFDGQVRRFAGQTIVPGQSIMFQDRGVSGADRALNQNDSIDFNKDFILYLVLRNLKIEVRVSDRINLVGR